MNQRTAQPQLLFHPTGQLPGDGHERAKVGAVQQLGNTRFAFSFCHTKETSEKKIDVLINRYVIKVFLPCGGIRAMRDRRAMPASRISPPVTITFPAQSTPARQKSATAGSTYPPRLTNQPDHTTGGNVQRDIVQRDRFSCNAGSPLAAPRE